MVSYGTLSPTGHQRRELSMKKLLFLLVLVLIGVAVARKFREV
jgi:hypothetical protein